MYALVLVTWDWSSWSSQPLLCQPGGHPLLGYEPYSCGKSQTTTATVIEKQYVWAPSEDLCPSWRPCNKNTHWKSKHTQKNLTKKDYVCQSPWHPATQGRALRRKDLAGLLKIVTQLHTTWKTKRMVFTCTLPCLFPIPLSHSSSPGWGLFGL